MTAPNPAQNVAQNVAIVTGGSTDIGWEIRRQMLDAGYEVVSLARRRPPQSHAKLHAVEVDLMDAAATGQAAADVASRFAVTHVVHACAGHAARAAFDLRLGRPATRSR
jgi:NAD(P)-dependent dehydrogenase (short-subunit alcohol dehydrogenase family)